MMCGKDILLVKNFIYIQRGEHRGEAKDFTISSSHEHVLKEPWCDVLHKNVDEVQNPKKNMNLFETDDYSFPAAVAIGLGCDVIPKSIKGVGLAHIKKVVDEKGPTVENLFSSYVITY